MLLSFLMAMGAAVRARTTRNLVYGAAAGAELDVYAPVGADGEAPVILFAHKGRAAGADRRRFRPLGAAMAARGFVTAIADGRLALQGADDGVEDIAAATAWLKDRAGQFGGDPSRLFLIGHAEGARCVARLSLETRWLAAHGLDTRALRGIVALSGAYDDPGPDEDASPCPAAPLLLMAGHWDEADPETTRRLAGRLRTRGAQVAEIHYPLLGGATPLRRLIARLRIRAMVLDEVERFVRLNSLGPGA